MIKCLTLLTAPVLLEVTAGVAVFTTQSVSIAHQSVRIDLLCDVISVYWSVPLVWVRNMAGVPSPHRVIILPHTLPHRIIILLLQSREVGGGGQSGQSMS